MRFASDSLKNWAWSLYAVIAVVKNAEESFVKLVLPDEFLGIERETVS